MKSTDINPNHNFSSLGLREALSNNIASLEYDEMTPIQAKSLPLMLAGQDVVAQAKTGSGKTAAFGLALLHHLKMDVFSVQALVLCPTRELAEQVTQVLRRLARLMPNIKILNLSGGLPMKPQTDSLRHGAHIIVGTPGRVQKHLDKESLSLATLQTLVLDEADRMLDMGFIDAIKNVLKFCPKKRQTLLFSATYSPGIKQLVHAFMNAPAHVVIEEVATILDIEQAFYELPHPSKKLELLKSILLSYQPTSTLIFCNTKEQTTVLSDTLSREGFSAIALNGDMEQVDRDIAMIRFSNQSAAILVATDVAARGLDIKDLPLVINFDVAFEHDVHIHRIGRTGRAGSKGIALTLTLPADAERLCAIEQALSQPLVWKNASDLSTSHSKMPSPSMVTVCINAGRKDKIRPGDVLGCLTKDAGLNAQGIGKIAITTNSSYVAIHQNQVQKAMQYLKNGMLKGRKVFARKL